MVSNKNKPLGDSEKFKDKQNLRDKSDRRCWRCSSSLSLKQDIKYLVKYDASYTANSNLYVFFLSISI